MSLVTLQGDRVLDRNLTNLERRVFPRAMARALNRTGGTVRSESVKDVSKATGLKQQDVRRRIVVRKRATPKDLIATVEATGKPLNLINFKARELKRGVSASPWGRRQKFSEAFIATMPNGKQLVVKRSAGGKAGKKIQRGRWAGKSPHIEAMWGPGIAPEAAQPALDRARRKVVRVRLPIELERELRFRVSKLRG